MSVQDRCPREGWSMLSIGMSTRYAVGIASGTADTLYTLFSPCSRVDTANLTTFGHPGGRKPPDNTFARSFRRCIALPHSSIFTALALQSNQTCSLCIPLLTRHCPLDRGLIARRCQCSSQQHFSCIHRLTCRLYSSIPLLRKLNQDGTVRLTVCVSQFTSQPLSAQSQLLQLFLMIDLQLTRHRC